MAKKFVSPVYNIRRVPVEKIEANDYNPNKVATKEMELLYTSIKEDGYTMPIVCYYDAERDKYIIVDGFHRYQIIKRYKNIYDREGGCLPVSVIDKDLNNRMASTIRHNRARGKHEVELQASLVSMLKDGWDELKIMKELGMTLEEVQRLLGLTGIFSEIKGVPYSIEKQIVEAGEDIPEEEAYNGDTDDVGACKYMVKRILLCDWEGNITWSRDNEFNYTREQIKEKYAIKKQDATIRK